MKMFLFFSHDLTDEQIDDAKRMGVKEFIKLPNDLQEKFSNVPPELECLDEYIEKFLTFLLDNSNKGDYVLIQGDFGIVYKIVEFAKIIGLIPVYATTSRTVIEIKREDIVEKKSIFKHIKFRKY